MITKRRIIPGIALIIIIAVGAHMSVRLAAQTPAQEPFDFSNAVYAEVRDSRALAILRGQFASSDEDPDEMERTATLAPVDSNVVASGEVEIEVSGSGPRRSQEIEFEVRNLQPGGVYTFVIDGRDFATVTADNRGKAEHEREIPLP
jgi:hypothetical protein